MMKLAYCGLNCDQCQVRLAGLSGDEEQKGKLAREYSVPECAFTAADMACEGCHSASVEGSKMCGACEIRNCAKGREWENCAFCPEFPCAFIEKYAAPGTENRANLDALCKK